MDEVPNDQHNSKRGLGHRQWVVVVSAGVALFALWLFLDPRCSPGGDLDGAGEPAGPEIVYPPPEALVAGRVIEFGDLDRGVGHAEVMAVCLQDEEPVTWTVTAGAQGEFWLGGLPEGRCLLRASASGYSAGGPNSRAHAMVEVRYDGIVDDIELVLYEVATLEGRVLANDSPLGGVRLTVLHLEAPGETEPFSIDPVASTSADGGFTIPTLIPGRLQLLAEHDDYALTESEVLHLRAGELRTGFVMRLTGTGEILGDVRDRQGRAIAGAQVRVFSERSRRSWRGESDRGGAFVVDEVTPGPVAVVVRATGFEDARLPGVSVVAGELTDVTLTLERRPGFGGIVLTPDGQPAVRAGIHVRFIPEEDVDSAVHRPARIYTDEEGRFWTSDASERPRVCYATHPSYGPSPETPVPTDGTEVVLRLTGGGRLVGRVVDTGGAPVTTYMIALQSYRPAEGFEDVPRRLLREHVDDSSGRFGFEGLTPGTYNMRITAAGFPTKLSSNHTVLEGSETDVGDLTLERGGHIVGMVIDSQDGEPIIGARVRAVGGRMMGVPGRARETLTDYDGRFSIAGVLPERLSLGVSAHGYTTKLTSGLHLEPEGQLDAGTIALDPVGENASPGQMQYSGIGAVLGMSDDVVIIRETFEDSPSADYGLEAGTEIHSVDGYSVSEMGLYETVELIRGASGTTVTLEVFRPESDQLETVRVERGNVSTAR